MEEIRRVHRENYECYGPRRVGKVLLREGIEVARCTIERLMSTNGIQGAKRRGKPWRTTTPDPVAKDVPDLVERDFAAERPNELAIDENEDDFPEPSPSRANVLAALAIADDETDLEMATYYGSRPARTCRSRGTD